MVPQPRGDETLGESRLGHPRLSASRCGERMPLARRVLVRSFLALHLPVEAQVVARAIPPAVTLVPYGTRHLTNLVHGGGQKLGRKFLKSVRID
uniref:Secreted protein n=1 Tax=Steinernema glaseri TaxID=37863 RepID=A0A1I7Y0H7_9BILA